MRTLRHPITVFIVTILIVIAVGVGIAAITQTSKVYGPSWGRFSVAFPGPECRYPLPGGSGFYYETIRPLSTLSLGLAGVSFLRGI